jgi:predicted phosphodiesterase
MKSDFEIIARRFEKPIHIYPIADVHFGSIQHRQREWERFLTMLEADEDGYVILDGDLINNNTRNSVGSPWEDTERPREQKRLMVEYLEPIRSKILCITTGNHERRSTKDADDDPTYDIACKLDLEDIYRENLCFLKVGIGTKDKGNGRKSAVKNSYHFCITHGSGGGALGGSTLNRNERFATSLNGVDCVIVGHTHKGQVSRVSKLTFDPYNNNITQSECVVISCVSWMDYGGYAAQKMLAPSVTARPQTLYLSDAEKSITVTW